MAKDKGLDIDKKRHMAKALTWRIVASFTTFIIAYLITGNVEVGLGVGAFDVVIKMILYYFHERVWYRINWGVRHRNKEE